MKARILDQSGTTVTSFTCTESTFRKINLDLWLNRLEANCCMMEVFDAETGEFTIVTTTFNYQTGSNYNV